VHGHGHHHGHGHSHGRLEPGRAADARRLTIALSLILALMAGEVVAGILADSIALLSDAAHMLTDAGALALALIVVRLAARPARGDLTFGLRRTEILSAQANGLTLLVLAGLIVYGAVGRLIDPPDPNGAIMLAVAVAGAAVNLLAVWQLAGANRESLNVEGAFQHVATDLAAFVATAVAGAVILATGYVRADGIAALVVAAIMLRSAVGLLRASGRVLLEAAPPGMSVDEVGRAMAENPGVVDVHDLHVWEVTSGFPSLSAHVLCGRGDDCHAVRRDLERMLAERFEIEHTTLQVDHAPARTTDVELGAATARRTPVERR
jgi:cobalt-zinc-cadmium efflux system protein